MKCPFKAAMQGKSCPVRPLFDAADRYLKACSWKDMALLKFCLFGMGLLVGSPIPKKSRGCAAGVGAVLFAVTYLPLMAKFLPFLHQTCQPEE